MEFKASLVHEPYGRTAKGRRVVAMVAHDMPGRRMGLLRRFTGETLFEFLIAGDESSEEMMAEAWELFSQGLIEAQHGPGSLE
ncbi:hypothetical protein [Roseateles sp.]|uniref:hypothetical protein n=1 Tax=Roseateles sp. TaxID=1971397 RepID=UPI003919B510